MRAKEDEMLCPRCGHAVVFGVVGRVDGQVDVWAMSGPRRWAVETVRRAQQEADERNAFAARGVAVFSGRIWEAAPLDVSR